MKKILLVLLTLMLLATFAACSEQTDQPQTPDFSVAATYANPSAADLLIETMQEENIAFTVENGFFDNIGGFASTQSDGWLLYYNGELAAVGAADIQLTDGDVVEFKWENYDEAFTLE